MADLKIALLARLGQLGAGESDLAQFGDELNDGNGKMGEEEAILRLEILQHSLVLCDESIAKFGTDSNQLLRKNDQKSLTKDQFYVAMRLLRNEFGVSVTRGSDSVVQDGETLADLRKALLASFESSNPQSSIIEPQVTHGDHLELLNGALQWCEESIKANGADSDFLLPDRLWRAGRKFLPILKSCYGVESESGGGLRHGTRTQAGTTLTDLKVELLADIADPDRPMSQTARMNEEERELPLLEGALNWCEASIKANGGDSDLLLTRKQWRASEKFAPILKTRFGVESANGGLRKGTRTQAGTTLTDLRRDLHAQIADPSCPIVRRVPKIVPVPVPIEITEAQKELLLLEGALTWCEASIKANGGDSDSLLSDRLWRAGRKFAPILKTRFGVEIANGGLRQGTHTQAGSTLTDLQRALLAAIADAKRLLSRSDRIESSESVKRLKMDEEEAQKGEDPSMEPGSDGFFEASDGDERQKLLAMGFESDAIRKAMMAYDTPDDVLESLLSTRSKDMDDIEEPVRSKRARPSE